MGFRQISTGDSLLHILPLFAFFPLSLLSLISISLSLWFYVVVVSYRVTQDIYIHTYISFCGWLDVARVGIKTVVNFPRL